MSPTVEWDKIQIRDRDEYHVKLLQHQFFLPIHILMKQKIWVFQTQRTLGKLTKQQNKFVLLPFETCFNLITGSPNGFDVGSCGNSQWSVSLSSSSSSSSVAGSSLLFLSIKSSWFVLFKSKEDCLLMNWNFSCLLPICVESLKKLDKSLFKSFLSHTRTTHNRILHSTHTFSFLCIFFHCKICHKCWEGQNKFEGF